MPPISRWTGVEAKLLRLALRRTVEDFAEVLGVHSRTINKWEARLSTITPVPELQSALDQLLHRAPADARERFDQLRADAQARCAERAQSPQPVERACPSVDADSEIAEFMRSDMATRRQFLEVSLLTGAALIVPVRQWASAAPLVPVERGRIGSAEITGLERAVEVFSQWDASGNGGLYRKAVLGQLQAVIDAIEDGHPSGDEQRLRAISADLAHLAGFMSWDAGLPDLAQRYYLYALNACKQIGELDLGAKVIGDMAQVSGNLGHHEDALALLRTALSTLPRNANPLVRAELHGHEASTYARFGRAEEKNSLRAVDAAFDAFDRATDGSRRPWNDYIDRAEVECWAASAKRRLALNEADPARAAELADRAEPHAHRASAERPGQLVRSRLLDQLRLSEIRMVQREPAESAALARKTLRAANGLSSTKLASRLDQQIRALADRYAEVPAVRELGAAFAHARPAAATT